MSRFDSSRRVRRFAWLLACLLSACEIGKINVPVTASGVVIHGVLNPSATTQVVLVERTLTGTSNLPDTTFDVLEPILSAGGIPISGAVVELIDSTGQIVRAIEDRMVNPNGKGAGVYRFALPGGALVLGARYQLHVHAPTGEDVTAFTRIPRPASHLVGGLTRILNRDHDVIATQWDPTPGARTYALRIESPFGPFFLFTDSTALRITGDLRNLFAGNLQRVFIPGFRQDITIAAVDSNFYDYYRTNNDPFTGAGIISRVNGGLGMFGSIVNLNTGTFTVIADQTEPVEGRFRLTPTSTDPNTPTTITLYIESKAAQAGFPSSLSGRYLLGGSTTRGDGLIGKLNDAQVSFALIANQLAGDTVDVFTGQLNGDTLRGSYTYSNANAVFVRIVP